MSVGAIEEDGAAAVWVDIAPAGRPRPPQRLRQAVEGAFAQAPQVQRRHRRALAAVTAGADEEGFALAEAWFAFHRQLFEVWYSPAIAALMRDEPMDGAAIDTAVAGAGRLSQAHAELVRAIRYAPSFPLEGPESTAGRLACWRLLRGHDGYLRSAVARASILTAASDGRQAAQLAALVADHLVADQMLAEHWAIGAADPTSALAEWAGYDQRLRDLIELAVLGPLTPFEVPAAPPVLPPDQSALDRVRTAVNATAWESPAVVARCRAVLAGLHGQDASTRHARDRVLRLWGRYDDMLSDLHAWLAGTRGGRATGRLLHAELALVARARDELVAVLDEQETPGVRAPS